MLNFVRVLDKASRRWSSRIEGGRWVRFILERAQGLRQDKPLAKPVRLAVLVFVSRLLAMHAAQHSVPRFAMHLLRSAIARKALATSTLLSPGMGQGCMMAGIGAAAAALEDVTMAASRTLTLPSLRITGWGTNSGQGF